MTNNERFPNNNIHDTAIIGDNVEIGRGNRIEAFTTIGLIGSVKGEKEPTGKVVISSNCVIQTGVRIESPVITDRTVIGSGCMIIHNAYIAHDCRIYEGVIICANVSLGGGVIVGGNTKIGMNASIKQRIKIGADVVIGMGAAVTKDIPIGQTWAGVPAKKIK